jgi:hypothetical protein
MLCFLGLAFKAVLIEILQKLIILKSYLFYKILTTMKIVQNTPQRVGKSALFCFYLINKCISGGSYLSKSGDITTREEKHHP